MDFCPIVPTAVLKKYLKHRKTWFALAHVNNFVYQSFYKQRPPGTTLILDNGAYEGKLRLNQFRDMIAYYEPEVVVLPDLYLQDSSRSLHLSLGFMEMWEMQHQEQNYQPQWMFVPQAGPGQVGDFIAAIAKALEDPRITWIGIPRCLVTDIDPSNPLGRVALARAIKKDFPYINIHALGMVRGNVHELYYLQNAEVASCDSSAPYWRHVYKDGSDINFEYKEESNVVTQDYFAEVDKCLATP